MREKTNHSQAFFFDIILMRTFFVHFTLLRHFFPKVTSLSISRNPRHGSRTTCWFKFGKNGVDAENAGIYGSQSRDDFDRDDVEQYFNYMGMLAVEGTHSKMEALLSLNIHPWLHRSKGLTPWLGVSTEEPRKLCSLVLKCLCLLEQTVFFGSTDEKIIKSIIFFFLFVFLACFLFLPWGFFYGVWRYCRGRSSDR